MKYVPTLRSRAMELGALSKSKLSSKTSPLLEIVKAPATNAEFQKKYLKVINSVSSNVIMIDIPLYIKVGKSTLSDVSKFLGPVIANPSLRIDYFKLLKHDNVIPVCTYNPNIPFISGFIYQQANELRKVYQRLAFRVFLNDFNNYFAEVLTIIRKGDILIFDINESVHTNAVFNPMFNKIQLAKSKIGFSSVLLRSAIPASLTNVSLVDRQVIGNIDNSLLKDYLKLGFSAFGDYTGVKKDMLTESRGISPACVFYSWHQNYYVGFRWRVQKPQEFTDHIAPEVTKSLEWMNYSQNHRQSCLGCTSINNIAQRKEKGDSAAKWKQLAILHYLCTMEEFL